MIQCRDAMRFSLEAIAKTSARDLDGHFAVEPRVTSPKDLAHSARPNRRKDLVGAQASYRTQRHGSSADSIPLIEVIAAGNLDIASSGVREINSCVGPSPNGVSGRRIVSFGDGCEAGGRASQFRASF